MRGVLLRLSSWFSRTAARLLLTAVYAAALLVDVVGRPFVRQGRKTGGLLVINATFHNPNWFFAHVEPIVRSNSVDVVLVCDEPVAELPGLRYDCPPRWAMRVFSRAGAKFLWTLGVGAKEGADLFMGYHIFPSAVTALVCARLLGARAAYQVTSGALELEGGGWHAENRLLVALGGPSPWVERLALAVARSFDLVVVRGGAAARFLREKGRYRHRLEIITGSVDARTGQLPETRDIDVIFVGRLTEYKRPDRLVEALNVATARVPGLRAVLVGEGPDRPELERRVLALGLEKNVEFLGKRADVRELMVRAKVFVLTSRWEGVSIAMLEAMALGAVPVVGDVGDLGDFVENGVTGYLLAEGDIPGYGDHIVRLLQDERLRSRLARAAREKVLAQCELETLARCWGEVIGSIVLAEPGPVNRGETGG